MQRTCFYILLASFKNLSFFYQLILFIYVQYFLISGIEIFPQADFLLLIS